MEENILASDKRTLFAALLIIGSRHWYRIACPSLWSQTGSFLNSLDNVQILKSFIDRNTVPVFLSVNFSNFLWWLGCRFAVKMVAMMDQIIKGSLLIIGRMNIIL